MTDVVTCPASGKCASCGTRVRDSMGFGIYQPADSPQRFLYLLCPACKAAVSMGDRDAVLRAVEWRVHFGRGARS